MIDLSIIRNEPSIYLLRNLLNGKIYVGGAVDVRTRILRHIAELNRGVHHNPHLQNAWKKYGGKAWEVEVLESIETSDIDFVRETEQKWLDSLKPYEHSGVGYNVNKLAAMPSSTSRDKMSHTRRGRKVSTSVLEKRSITLMSNCPVKPGDRYGRLVVIICVGKSKSGGRLWECQCDCGGIKVIRQDSFRDGSTTSCGCRSKEAAAETGRANRKHGRYAKEK